MASRQPDRRSNQSSSNGRSEGKKEIQWTKDDRRRFGDEKKEEETHREREGARDRDIRRPRTVSYGNGKSQAGGYRSTESDGGGRRSTQSDARGGRRGNYSIGRNNGGGRGGLRFGAMRGGEARHSWKRGSQGVQRGGQPRPQVSRFTGVEKRERSFPPTVIDPDQRALVSNSLYTPSSNNDLQSNARPLLIAVPTSFPFFAPPTLPFPTFPAFPISTFPLSLSIPAILPYLPYYNLQNK